MFLIRPAKDFARLYSQILFSASPAKSLFFLFFGLLVGWWVYVPIHELLHAAGCLIGGGEVSKLEIKAMYGGTILSQIFSFVSAEGSYAGRLSGFDTRGSDWAYALTVYFPFLLSIPGFLLLEISVCLRAAVIFGFFLPCAFAPLISLTGDFFELGSLLLYQIWPGAEGANRTLISDDLFRLMEEMASGSTGGQPSSSNILFVTTSLLMGFGLAWGTILVSNTIRVLAVKGNLRTRFRRSEDQHKS
jgi:hypothetical protein